jgi:hypothetical protein
MEINHGFESFSVIVVADARNGLGEINLEMHRIGSQVIVLIMTNEGGIQ